jgi:hypothetical protein
MKIEIGENDNKDVSAYIASMISLVCRFGGYEIALKESLPSESQGYNYIRVKSSTLRPIKCANNGTDKILFLPTDDPKM